MGHSPDNMNINNISFFLGQNEYKYSWTFIHEYPHFQIWVLWKIDKKEISYYRYIVQSLWSNFGSWTHDPITIII